MGTAAVVNAAGIVVNLIVADPSVDAAPDGCLLIANPPDGIVLFTSTWDGSAFGGLQIAARAVGQQSSPVNGVETL